MKPLNSIVAPNLPAPTPTYDAQAINQFNNVLRLYFNQLDNNLSSLISNIGGAYLRFPNGAFHQDGYTTLTANMTNTSTASIQVTSTADFLSAGALLIGNELIKYTGKTATTFTGITRGQYASSTSAHSINDYVSEAQPVTSSTIPLVVSFTKTDVSNQVSISPTDNTKIVHTIAGYYNIQFSIQLASYDNTIDDVTLWFRQNGSDVANSAGIVSVPAIHAGSPGAAIISWNIVLPLNANDYIQLIMASNLGNTVAITYPPGTAPVHPSSPSIILSSTFVSALYDTI